MTETLARQAPAARPAEDAPKHLLPPLPYDAAALEPHLDRRTMLLHHGKHHASYVEKLNAALEGHPDLQRQSAPWLLAHLRLLPPEIRTAVRSNAGGHLNHSLFWQAMSPAGGGAPEGALADAIERDFGSFEHFKTRFDKAGAALFGSGWVWLASAPKRGGRLDVLSTAGHDHPLMRGRVPLLLNDVWEHAYYLKHQNRRADYLRGWWQVVDWQAAARLYENSSQALESPWTRKTF